MVKDKNVAVIRNQTLEPGLNFHKSHRQDLNWQEKALGIGILGAPPALVLNYRSPEQDPSVNQESLKTRPAQMLQTVAGINSAGALQMRGTMRTMLRLVTPPPQCEIANTASGLQGFPGSPSLTIE